MWRSIKRLFTFLSASVLSFLSFHLGDWPLSPTTVHQDTLGEWTQIMHDFGCCLCFFPAVLGSRFVRGHAHSQRQWCLPAESWSNWPTRRWGYISRWMFNHQMFQIIVFLTLEHICNVAQSSHIKPPTLLWAFFLTTVSLCNYSSKLLGGGVNR